MNDELIVLDQWRSTLTEMVRSDQPDLSARQLTLLLTVFLQPGPHTVRGLAERLKVAKPAISRALDRLGQLGLVRRRRDEADRRNVLVQRTVKGSLYLMELGRMIQTAQQQNPLASRKLQPWSLIDDITAEETAGAAAMLQPQAA